MSDLEGHLAVVLLDDVKLALLVAEADHDDGNEEVHQHVVACPHPRECMSEHLLSTHAPRILVGLWAKKLAPLTCLLPPQGPL